MRLVRTFKSLPPGWRESFYLMAREGVSEEGLYTSIGLTQSIHEKFMRDEPSYAEQIEFCNSLTKAYWLDLGRDIVKGKATGTNAAAYLSIMVNRFGWVNIRQSTGEKKERPKKETDEADEPIDINKFKRRN